MRGPFGVLFCVKKRICIAGSSFVSFMSITRFRLVSLVGWMLFYHKGEQDDRGHEASP